MGDSACAADTEAAHHSKIFSGKDLGGALFGVQENLEKRKELYYVVLGLAKRFPVECEEDWRKVLQEMNHRSNTWIVRIIYV